MGNSSNSININKDLRATGEVKAAITGINHTNRSGSGEIAQFWAIITTGNINGKDLHYYRNVNYISDIKATDIHGNPIVVNAGIDSNRVALRAEWNNRKQSACCKHLSKSRKHTSENFDCCKHKRDNSLRHARS